MKKATLRVLIAVIITVLVVSAGFVGGYFITKAIKAKNDPAKIAGSATSSDGITYTVSYLEKDYETGDNLVFKVVANNKTAMSSLKFTIDNGEEQSTTVTTKKNDDGTYTLDTGVETYSLTGLAAGEHMITFYVYGSSNTRYKLGSAIVFNVTEA